MIRAAGDLLSPLFGCSVYATEFVANSLKYTGASRKIANSLKVFYYSSILIKYDEYEDQENKKNNGIQTRKKNKMNKKSKKKRKKNKKINEEQLQKDAEKHQEQ